MKVSKLVINNKFIQDMWLSKHYGSNIHDLGLDETIKTGIVDKLMGARELGVDYCVVFGGVVPGGSGWDPYGDGKWNPRRKDFITTQDIAREDNDRELERQNVYAFLRGEENVKSHTK